MEIDADILAILEDKTSEVIPTIDFIIEFEEKYDDIYGLPKFSDLDISYDTINWPIEIKDFIKANITDILTIKDWKEYNTTRAKLFTKYWQELLTKYVGPITINYVNYDFNINATINERDFEKIKEFANKVGINTDKLPETIIGKVMEYLLDQENLTYDDIANQIENNESVKKYYMLPVDNLNMEFEFVPELTNIQDLNKYNKVDNKYILTIDSPDQLRLNFESLDKDILAILNENSETEIRKSIIDKFSNFIIDELSELDKIEYVKSCDIDELIKWVKWEDVFFHLAKDQADTNPNFFSFRAKAAHNKDNIMTDEEDNYFWNLNDARHLTLAKQVANNIRTKL